MLVVIGILDHRRRDDCDYIVLKKIILVEDLYLRQAFL